MVGYHIIGTDKKTVSGLFFSIDFYTTALVQCKGANLLLPYLFRLLSS
jgi:hypothetical protein